MCSERCWKLTKTCVKQQWVLALKIRLSLGNNTFLNALVRGGTNSLKPCLMKNDKCRVAISHNMNAPRQRL